MAVGWRAENNEAHDNEIQSETVSLDYVSVIPVNLSSVLRQFDSNMGTEPVPNNKKNKVLRRVGLITECKRINLLLDRIQIISITKVRVGLHVNMKGYNFKKFL